MSVKPIPEGYHTVTPYLNIQGAAELIEFLQKAFAARVKERIDRPDGAIVHAEIRIGDSIVMLSDPGGDCAPMPGAFYLYVTDADAAYKCAIEAGATSVMEPTDQFWGDRQGGVKDRFGNLWWIATRVEGVSEEELQRRMAALL
jgi:PhnB protein